jgi:MFS transporter, DHA2 family, multidrug resistance protein
MNPTTTISAVAALPRTRAPDNKWLVTVSITFGTLMGAIDSSIVNVALPHIRGAVGATVEEIAWISTAYLIATVVVMPLTGFLGSMFGQKRVYVSCLILFLIGSALCGMARSLETLVVFRAIQGLGAGALQPTEQAILRQTFPPKEQGMAMALFAMAVMVGPAIGPTLGGWITDNYDWPWIFYINLPIGMLGLSMVLRFVHEPDDVRRANRVRAATQRANLDWQGIVLLCVGLASLQYFLEEGQRHDWFDSGLITFMAALAGVALAAFVIRELTARAPVVNVSLFKDRTFLSGTLISGVMFAMLMGSMFLLPLFMQEVLGYDATDSGLVTLPRTLIMMAVTPIVGRIYNRVHPGILVAIGVILFALGSYELSHVTLDSSMRQIILPLLITGVAFAFLFVPLATASLSHIPRPQLTDATGLNSLFRMTGGSIGLALFATALGRYVAHAHAAVASHVSALAPAAAQRLAQIEHGMLARGLAPHTAHDLALRALAGRVGQQTMVLAFEKTFLVQGLSFLAVLPLLLFLRAPRHGKPARVEMHME